MTSTALIFHLKFALNFLHLSGNIIALKVSGNLTSILVSWDYCVGKSFNIIVNKVNIIGILMRFQSKNSPIVIHHLLLREK